MKTLRLYERRALLRRRGQFAEVVSEQELSSFERAPVLRPLARHTVATPERMAEIRRDIAADVYLRKDTERQIAAVVNGLLRDMMTDLRQASARCRAAV
jgi:hypothetical protein